MWRELASGRVGFYVHYHFRFLSEVNNSEEMVLALLVSLQEHKIVLAEPFALVFGSLHDQLNEVTSGFLYSFELKLGTPS